MKKLIIVMVGLTFCIYAQDFTYVGNAKCKTCHRKAEIGNQFKQWADGPHAKAFETLTTEESAKIAKELGIEGNAWEAPECLKCHTTGYGDGGYEVKDETFWKLADPEDKAAKKAIKRMKGLMNVGCEVCHGAGSGYKSKSKMKAVRAEEITYESVGLLKITEETCIVCHNEDSPTHKSFNYEERITEFEHPIPESEN